MKKLMKGNEALAEAAIRAGCKYYFGYPITPQTEISEYMAKQLPKRGGVFLQAESEVAAINMVYGAAATGVRVMTSSSGPGISLKAEGISYLAGADLPCLVVNIMRAGPGLGGILPSQSDYFQATKGGGHGDYHCIVYAPATVQEMADLTIKAFDVSDEYRVPAMILGDGNLGQTMEPIEFDFEEKTSFIDKKWATNGTNMARPKNIVNSLYTDPVVLENLNIDRHKRYAKIIKTEPMAEEYLCDDAEIVFVSYGTTARICKAVVQTLRNSGIKAGLVRPITLWPFPSFAMQNATKKAKRVITVELSHGQMIEDVRLALPNKTIEFYGRSGGIVPTVSEIVEFTTKGGNNNG